MDSREISKHYHLLTDEQKRRFIVNFKIFLAQGEDAMALRGPYSFFLDSNIIMRLEELKNVNYSEGILSIMLFFDFYKNQSVFCADLLITPVVFYEFYRLKNVGSIKEYWGKFRSIQDLIENALGVEVLSENLDSYEKTKYYISSIEHDAELIKARLKDIKKDELYYELNISNGPIRLIEDVSASMEIPPLLFADRNLYKDLDTKYFDPFYVSLFLKDHMAYKISTNSENNKKIAEKYADDYMLRKVVFVDKKEKVKGLADIELLSKCNVMNQFDRQAHGTSFPASIPLTIDTNLFLSLRKRSGYGVSSEEIVGGEDPGDMEAKLDSFWKDGNRRMGRADEQKIKYLTASIDYMEGIADLL